MVAAKRLERARVLNQGYVYQPPQAKVVLTREEQAAYLDALHRGRTHWGAMQEAGHIPVPGELQAFLDRLGWRPSFGTAGAPLG